VGLIYDAGDSSSVKSALSGNLATASSVLDELESASDRLVAALGTGELSGKGYSAVDALFAQVITPCISDAKSEIDSIQSELDTYARGDSKVSQYGVLKEDELNTQLTATKNQRDATERLIEVNRDAANAATAVPGLSESLHATNTRLEIVLTQLENDVRDLEDKLQALRDFASATRGLFLENLENLAAVTGDTVALLKQLNETHSGFTLVDDMGVGLGAIATRKKILDHLAGQKITLDADGRVRWGDRFLYRPKNDYKSQNLYSRGKDFNKATGTRIDRYKKPFKAGGTAALAAPIDDFRGWKDASTLGKFGKGLGVAGTVLTVGSNANNYFSDGVQGYDFPDFAVDTGVDLASAAAAAGVGAAVGSLLLPPLGTVVGALVGIVVSMALNADLGGTSATDAAKDAIKKTYR
jgi:hypothetical protein